MRVGEHCRICPPGSTWLPLQTSAWGYETHSPIPSVWGGSFLLVIAVVCGGYFGGGYAINVRKRGKTGMQALPHHQVWVEVAGLVKDGLVRTGLLPPPPPPDLGGGRWCWCCCRCRSHRCHRRSGGGRRLLLLLVVGGGGGVHCWLL